MAPDPRTAFGRAAATLARQAREQGLRAFAVTAAVPGEGTTTITAHLGRELTEVLGLRVLMVELGAGGLSLARALEGLENRPVAVREADIAATNATWALLDLPAARNGALASLRARLASVLEAAAGRFDLVIIDAPAMSGGLGAMFAAQSCGHVLLVVGAGNLPFEPLQALRDELEEAGVQILGAVLNRRRDPVPRWLRGLLK